jgi:plasmid stabilization system protein ParE
MSRVISVNRFRIYLVFYRTTAERLEVLGVLHAARDIDSVLADFYGAPDQPDTP